MLTPPIKTPQSEETFVKAGLNRTTHSPTISTQPSLNPTILAAAEPTFTTLNPTKPVLAVENTPVPIEVADIPASTDETLTPMSSQPTPYPTDKPILSIETTADPTVNSPARIDDTKEPTLSPTPEPTSEPTAEPTLDSTPEPTKAPVTKKPTHSPTPGLTPEPTPEPTPGPTFEPTKAPVAWWGVSWDETSELSWSADDTKKPSRKPTHKMHTHRPTSRKPTKHPTRDNMSFLFHFDSFEDSFASRSSKSKKLFPKTGKMSKTMFVKSGKENSYDSEDDEWSGVLKASSYLEINPENKSSGFTWSLGAVTAVALLGLFVSL